MKWILSVLLLLFVAWILPGVTIESFWVAILVSIVLGVIQLGAKLLFALFLPLTTAITILTFGIFLLIMNAICIQLTSNLVGGFHVVNFGSVLLFGAVYSLLYSLLLRD